MEKIGCLLILSALPSLELVYAAYEVYIGNSGSGFVTRDTVIYRYKNTKNIEENLNHYYLMK